MNWIICAGMRRSGSVLQYHITREVLRDTPFNDHNFIKVGELGAMVAQPSNANILNLGKMHARLLPEYAWAHNMLVSGEMKAVYIFRNLLDVRASIKKFIPTTPLSEHNAIVKEHRYWSRAPGVLISKYDQVTSNIAGEAIRIAEFLGIPISQERATEIGSHLHIDKQRSRLPKKGYDTKNCIWYNHVTDGKSGKWHDELGQHEIDYIYRIGRDIIQEYQNEN